MNEQRQAGRSKGRNMNESGLRPGSQCPMWLLWMSPGLSVIYPVAREDEDETKGQEGSSALRGCTNQD